MQLQNNLNINSLKEQLQVYIDEKENDTGAIASLTKENGSIKSQLKELSVY